MIAAPPLRTDHRRLVIVGAHPDDPETCAGGLAALATRAGHEVALVYLTDGQAGVPGIDAAGAAALRRAEAVRACAALGAVPVFLGMADGGSTVDDASLRSVRDALERLGPDIVVTHWPIDTHRDHRVCSSLVLDAWLDLGTSFPLYYMEALSGYQTANFEPTDLIDITSVAAVKEEACFAHVSQGIDAVSYLAGHGHGLMARARGRECGVEQAEAYIRQEGGPRGGLESLLSGPCVVRAARSEPGLRR